MAKFQDQFVYANGIRTRVWKIGEGGVPLVLLHGLGGTVEDWTGVLRPLAAQRQVVAIHLLGCGMTAGPLDGGYALDAMRDHVMGTLDALGLDRFDLNGWSLGGRIALDIAHKAPDRLRRLILTAPAGVGQETILNLAAPWHVLLGQTLSRPAVSGFRIMGNALVSGGTRRLFQFARRRVTLAADKTSRDAFMAQLRSFVGPSGYLAAPREDLMRKLPQIETPTLAIWGRGDNFAPLSHARILTDKMPNCALHIIERCGHTPHIEKPEEYLAATLNFLETQ